MPLNDASQEHQYKHQNREQYIRSGYVIQIFVKMEWIMLTRELESCGGLDRPGNRNLPGLLDDPGILRQSPGTVVIKGNPMGSNWIDHVLTLRKTLKAIFPYSGGVTGSKKPDNNKVGTSEMGIVSKTWGERGTFQLIHSS